MKLNEKLKNERILRKISQTALAERFGVSRASVSAWEQGERTPSVKYLRMYSKTFSLDADFFKNSHEKCLDLSLLNDEGILKMENLYNSLIKSKEFTKKS